MTPWTLCLLALACAALPFRLPASSPGRAPGSAWWRSWAALLAASLAGKVFPDPAAWVLIDLVAAAIVIFPPRAGFQKAIAWLFAAMMLFELGWLLSDRMNSFIVVDAGAVCGWLQLAALLAWGVDERFGASRLLDWFVGSGLADHAVDAK